MLAKELRLARPLALAAAFACGCTGSISGSNARKGPGVQAADQPLLRRLTRAQYDNTVRDLLGITGDPAASFAEDEDQAGFAANSSLPVQDLQVEQYQDAAEALAATSVGSNLSAIVGCAPADSSEASCSESFIRSFGRRAYRRPLTTDEVTAYLALFAAGRANADFASGVALVLRAMLQSPYFLYRVELGTKGSIEADGATPLTSFEMASRLSYFIWNTMPDATLLAAADADQLRDPATVSALARQMLGDPRARDTMISFHEQWLGLQGLGSLEKTDPAFTPELRAAMREEFDDLSDDVRLGDGRLETLLGGNTSFVEPPLFSLYGIAGQAPANPSAVVQVALPANRLGLLTSAAVLATHAHVDQTSLVHRGEMVREQLLCTLLPPPPPDVDTTPPPVDPNVSARLRFEQHTKSPACGGCHSQMDPLGTPFETYDAIGRYRTQDGNQPVDSSGSLQGSATHDGPVVNAIDLMQRLAVDDTVRRCVATEWFRFAFGRLENDGDQAAIGAAFQTFSENQYRIPDLIVALTATRAFRYRQAIPGP